MLGKVVHPCNPSTWEAEAEDQKFKVILSYTAILRPVWTI